VDATRDIISAFPRLAMVLNRPVAALDAKQPEALISHRLRYRRKQL
jgi:hypothetical protein